jgi:hypothetical protein
VPNLQKKSSRRVYRFRLLPWPLFEKVEIIKSLIQRRIGGPEVLELTDSAKPARNFTEVLLRVHATSINLVDFCDPHSPWQRSSNENINGLIRQYLPKGTDLSVYSQEQLDAIAYELSIRPRKRFNWKCPIEVMTEVMGKAMAMQHDAPASIQ